MSLKIMLTTSVLTGGGAERVVSVWASELAEKGYDISLLLAGRTENEYPLSDKVKVYTIAPTYSAYQKMSKIQKILGRRAVLKSVRPDYLISFLPHIQVLSLVACVGLGIKRIETVRISPWHAEYNHGLNKILWKLCFETGSGIIIQSKDQAGYFRKAVQKKCVVIPNPISEVYEKRVKSEISEEIVRFIAAGRISPQKNYPMMIKGFARAIREHDGDPRYRRVYLDIFGAEDGGYLDPLKQLVKDLGMEKNVFFRGRSSTLDEEMRKSDAFLMTSDYEGMPNALIEAMASQLLCISTDCVTGPRDIIDHGENGYLIPVGDEVALARYICQVIEMPYAQRVQMCLKGREKVLTMCSKENSIAKLCDLLKE